MRKGIVFKLFFITVFMFIFVLGILMAGQTLFFEKFYFNHKIGKLERNMELFSASYTQEQWDKTKTTQNINRFSDQNNSQIAILDENGAVKYSPSFDIVIETEEKKKIKTPLSNIVYLNGFQQLELALGAEVEIDGFFSADFSQSLSVLGIQKGNRIWTNTNTLLVENVDYMEAVPLRISISNAGARAELPKIQTEPAVDIVQFESSNPNGAIAVTNGLVSYARKKVKGKIVELNIPTQLELLANYNKDLLWNAIDYWNWLLKTGNTEVRTDRNLRVQYYSGVSKGSENMILVKPIRKEDDSIEFLFTVSSLQPVGEAVEVMRDYYLYALLFALALIAGMALLYSKMISKPLIQMNHAAAKMAKLDFSEKCKVRSRDELGNLAVNLNCLSENLNSTLQELKTANEQLQSDIEKERNLEKLRKEFISGVSHEFKTPLGIIRGFAEGLKDHIAEGKRDHYLEVIIDEIGKMDDLVLDLLDLSRLESGMYKLKWECFCILELLREVEHRIQESITEKGIHVEYDSHASQVPVLGDVRRIEQVVMNIMSNAVRHTPKAGHIRVSLVKKEDLVMVSVENQGEPIPEAELSKVWDRFYRVEKSRGRKAGGTGLGLSIVKNIVELHGREYGVINTEEGVCFYFAVALAPEGE